MSNASETILTQYGWDALSGLEIVQAIELSKHGKTFAAKLCKSMHIADCWLVSYATNSQYSYDFYNTAAEAEKAYKKEAKYVARVYAQY